MSLQFFQFKSLTLLASCLVIRLFSIALAAAEAERPYIPAYPIEEVLPTLRPLVETAAVNSWQMNLQDILIRRAEAMSMRYSSAKNAKVSLNANLGYQIQETGSSDSQGTKYRFDIIARKPLYSWGADEADHQYGLLQVKRVKQDRQLAFLTIYRNLVFKFIDLQVLRQRAVASALDLEVSSEELELRRDQVERGEYPATQFATLELNQDRDQLNHEALLNAIRKAENILREEIGLEEDSPLNMGDGLPPVANDLFVLEDRMGGFLGELEENSLKVKAMQARLDQANERLKKYEVNQRPMVNGMLRLRRDSDNVITGDRRNLEYTEGFAGLEFNWNIYDGKNTRGYVMDSLEARRQLVREIEILKSDIRDDLDYLLSDLKIQRQQSLLNEETYAWEIGRFKQKEEDVEAGRSPEKELKEVQLGLEQQRTNLYNSRAYYYKTLTNLYVTMEYSSILAYLE